MNQADNNRFFNMAEVYDKMAPLLVPCYDFLQDEIIRFTNQKMQTPKVIIDLGAGSGILLEKLLTAFPTARCYWIDFSDDFMRIARKRLHRFEHRVTFVQSTMEASWQDSVREDVDLITSMTAVHHLETAEKKDLYQRCYDILADNGWFFNIDEMKSVSENAYKNSLLHLVGFVEQSESRFHGRDAEYYREFCSYLDRWKIRNVDQFDQPKTKGEDIHESFTDQIQWLDDAGFQDTDLFVKYHLWSMIGGRKVICT